MKILILGGTQFVGRHIAEMLLTRGHSVSVFNRGKTLDELSARVERLRGDRDSGFAGLSALNDRIWDVCVNVSGFTARHVRASAGKLRNRIGHYVFISAVSVYGDRPNGPVDPFDRFSYWVQRAGTAGEILTPGDGSDHVQVVDARDVARFTSIACEGAIAGTFNLAGPRLAWRKSLSVIGCRNPVWVNAEFLQFAGVTQFDLPLYRRDGGPRSSLMYVSNERAMAAGLTLTDLRITAEDVRRWLNAGAKLQPALSREREAELIHKFRSGARLANPRHS